MEKKICKALIKHIYLYKRYDSINSGHNNSFLKKRKEMNACKMQLNLMEGKKYALKKLNGAIHGLSKITWPHHRVLIDKGYHPIPRSRYHSDAG